MLRYRANVLLIDDERPFLSMNDPSFRHRWSVLLFHGTLLQLSFGEAVLLATGFFLFSALLGLEIIKCRFENQINQIDNDDTRVAFRAAGTGPTSWIPTASAVRYYTVTQSLLWLLCFPLSCQQTWCCSCWVCAMEDRWQNRYSTLAALVIYLWSSRSVNLLIERPALIVFGSSVEQIGCSLTHFVVWSSGAIDHRLQCVGCITLFQLLLAIDCERIDQ